MGKNRGKNKKKQWRSVMKNAEKEIELVRSKKAMNKIGFSVVKEAVKAKKGNKKLAKDFPHVVTAYSGNDLPKIPVRTINHDRDEPVDIWASSETKKPSSEDTSHRVRHTIDLPLKGQSYNPTPEDHEALIKFLEEDEKRKLTQEIRLKNFFAPTKYAIKNSDPLSLAKEYFKTRDSYKVLAEHIEETHVPGDDYEPPKAKKFCKEALKRKNHRIEMANLHRIVKEEKMARQEIVKKREAKQLRRKLRAELKKSTDNIAFQLPEDKVDCVRRLVPEGSLLSAIQSRRDFNPLKRTSLNIDKSKKKVTRRHRKDATVA